ncbi:MAG TPA: AI-2E family transporter [Nevskiaceae bacterium]|nr:AI-2E family transporter [Nevskiaceae bacterium]
MTLPHPPLARTDLAAWLLCALGLILVLQLGLLPALLAGLLVYELVHLIAPRLRARPIDGESAKLITVALLSILIVASLSALIVGAIAFFRSDAGSLTALINRLAEIIETSRSRLPAWLVAYLPDTAEDLRLAVVAWLREHSEALQGAGAELGRALAHILIGMVVGAMVSLREARPNQKLRPLAASLAGRAERLARSFRNVVFAQVWIAAVNATLTGLYLALVLPLLGVDLPLTKTLIAITFLCGLLPVLGNLISNTVITIVSLSVSLWVAIGSLAYLVVIHKLEYFLNARIIGGRIRARAWELLVAMLAMEAAFGIAGLVAAPVYYAYLKDELSERGLI